MATVKVDCALYGAGCENLDLDLLSRVTVETAKCGRPDLIPADAPERWVVCTSCADFWDEVVSGPIDEVSLNLVENLDVYAEALPDLGPENLPNSASLVAVLESLDGLRNAIMRKLIPGYFGNGSDRPIDPTDPDWVECVKEDCEDCDRAAPESSAYDWDL